MQRIDEEGRDAPDFRTGELRDTTRRLHLVQQFSKLLRADAATHRIAWDKSTKRTDMEFNVFLDHIWRMFFPARNRMQTLSCRRNELYVE